MKMSRLIGAKIPERIITSQLTQNQHILKVRSHYLDLKEHGSNYTNRQCQWDLIRLLKGSALYSELPIIIMNIYHCIEIYFRTCDCD